MTPKKSNAFLTLLATVFLALFIAAMLVASPLIALLVGMFVGFVLEFFTGDYVVQAFNVIGLSGVKDGDLPKVFGLLAVVGTLLKVGFSNAKKSDKKTDEE